MIPSGQQPASREAGVSRRVGRLLALLVLSLGVARAQVTEKIRGRVGRDSSGQAVLTLELESARLGLFADKPGQEADHALPALRDLIEERFKYLLRLRMAEREFAPTSVSLALPPAGTAVPEALILTAIWARPGVARPEIVTNADSPVYRFALELAPVGGAAQAPVSSAPVANRSAADGAAAESWRATLAGAVATGIAQIVPGGGEHLLFALAFYFAARRFRELASWLAAFALAHSLTLGLTVGGVISLGNFFGGWVAVVSTLSIVAIAVGHALDLPAHGRAWLAVIAGFGLVHGMALGAALSATHWPEDRRWPAVLAANFGIEIGLSLILVLAVVFTAGWWEKPWYRPRLAVPANVVIGLTGLAWTVERVRALYAVSP